MADVQWVLRKDWGARAPRGGYGTMPSRPRGVKVHYTGGHENPDMPARHTLCVARARSVQNGHMDGNGWIDVGYSYMVCTHGKVFEARGFGHLPAANGAGLNSGHYAVLGMVGNSGLTQPSDAMLNGIRDVIEYLRGRGVGNEIRGHRDGYSTDCPGSKLYAWVKAGAPRPKGSETPVEPVPPVPAKPAPTPPPKDDDMTYTSLGWSGTGAKTIPASTPTDVVWDTEYADPTKGHAEGTNPSFLDGPRVYVLDVELVLTGLTAGDVVETRLVEVKAKTSPGEILESTRWRPTHVLPGGDGTVLVTHQGIGAVQEGRKLRLQVQHNGAGTVKISRAWARMNSQES
jgi:hypothetical protein